MSNKKLFIGLGVILIAGAIFLVSEKMASISPPEHRTRFFPALEARHVTKIAVNERGGVTVIEKADSGWTVSKGDESFPADDALVQIAVERIVSLKKGELISENPANRDAFEVGDGNGTSVGIFAGGKDSPDNTLLIGKSGPDWNSNYARLMGSDEVYLIPGGLRQALFFDIDRWRKKEPEPEPAPAVPTPLLVPEPEPESGGAE
jgi:hypothetical protein